MPKINSYDNKAFTDIVQEADFLIVTNGAQEYNISIEEFFNWHLNATSHDHSAFKNETEIRSLAQAEATTIVNNAITTHETSYDHSSYLTAATVAPIVNTQIAATSIGTLADVNTTGVINGQTLIYDSYTGWTPGTIAGGGASYLDDLNDVSTYGVQNGQILIYDSYTGWTPGIIAGGASYIWELTDVTIDLTYEEDQILVRTNNAWRNRKLNIAELGDVDISQFEPPIYGSILFYDSSSGTPWKTYELKLDLLRDVNISMPQAGSFLMYDGNDWVETGTPGVSGSFTSADGKTVNVVDGIITSIDVVPS